ncbi:C-C motif chemokine 14 isoform X1 [Suncus etruscus]|uniref:C-C motif chemokine 14 isoform X1 n=1 Tax=Suncus etruscus TaxID=109475 RepID=UPI0021108D98|nr:C-C motif chemokine 14 isoform X1 [Suncus etruscus]
MSNPDKRVESDPTSKSPISKMSALPTQQETLHENQLTPRTSLSGEESKRGVKRPRQASSQEKRGGPYQPTECCFKFTTRVFPLYRIKSYYKTGSQCTRPGIIFITKRDYLICANPNDNWVQSHIRNLQEQQ